MLLLGATLGACASGDGELGAAERKSTSTTTDAASGSGAPSATPAESPEAAVEALLAADKAADHTASFRLLDPASRRTYADVADWARRRSELPPVTAFEVEGVKDNRVTAVVEHEAGLDPFVGLRPGRERQVWIATEVKGGWLLAADPRTTPIFPPTADATAGAQAWLDAADRCDAEAVAKGQAVEVLYGEAALVKQLCEGEGPVTAGPATALAGGLSSQDLVAQYGPEAFEWAKAVPVTGRGRPMSVVLAPIGDRWLVVAINQQ